MEASLRCSFSSSSSSKSSLDSSCSSSAASLTKCCPLKLQQQQQDDCRSVDGEEGGLLLLVGASSKGGDEINSSPVHKMLEVQSLYKPAPSHQPTAKRRRLRLTSVPLVDLRAPQDEGSLDGVDLYGSLNSPPRSLLFDADSGSLSNKSGVCSMSESMDSQRLGSSRIRHMNSSWETESRFPKLNECAHFHYEFVELGPINVCLYEETQENTKSLSNGGDVEHGDMFSVQVSSNGKSWVVRRSYDNFHMLDRQLHQCVYDRKFSALPEIVKDERRKKEEDDDDAHSDHGSIKRTVSATFSEYLQRFSDIAGNLISCGPILNWLELDNRGNRLIVTDDSAINTPAVAAAYVTKRYIAQANDEISFEVGDMISVIDMPPSDESIWWRGKRGFEVGFFPSDCVEVIGDKVPHTIHIPKAPTKPVLRKHGKLIAFFRSFILSRPSRRKLKQSGILKERVFGCDLGEHLLNSGHEIPMVLKCCADFIEGHGIVDGIYRLSGVTSNIQKLRNTFDEDRVPDLNDEAILQDIHSVASLLKMYFRELPNPLLTYQLYDKFVLAVQSDEEDRLLNVRDVVQQMPPPHYRTLEYLVKHLARVAAHGAETGMTPKNVAIVWAPNLLRSKDLEFGGVAALQVVGVQAVVTEFLIHYSDLIFNDKMPVFPPVLGAIGGTPKRTRPKSLAISTPTKLLSLEEARSRALGAGTQSYQKYIEVGGGPATLPTKYHTVIDFPDGKRGSTKNKKSPSGWKMFFTKGRSSSQSSRDREKPRRKPSTTPSDPGSSVALGDKVVTEADVTRNNSRLRSVKSAESLVSSSATSSHRNSEALDSVTFGIQQSLSCAQSRIAENVDNDEEDLMSSSLGAVPSSQKQSPHSHIRSVSHDSYFEFTLDRRREERLPGELSTILSEENDDDSESHRLVLDDFGDVAADMSYMKICYADQEKDFNLIGCMDEITPNLTQAEANSRVSAFDSEPTVTNDLNNRLSFDFDDGLRDIVGDIQQEVAAALHWDKDTLASSSNTCTVVRSSVNMSPSRDRVVEPLEDHSSNGKVIVERYGNEQTVIIEVHATEDSSHEEESKQQPQEYSDQNEAIQIHSLMSPICSFPPIDSLEEAEAVLVSTKAETEVELSFSDSLECSHETPRLEASVCDNVEHVTEEAGNTLETRVLIEVLAEDDHNDVVTASVQNVDETVPRILVREPTITASNDELQFSLSSKRRSTDEPSTTLVPLETTSPGDCTESDSSLTSHFPSASGNLSSNASPSDEVDDLFAYSVLTNDELTPLSPLESESLVGACIPTIEEVNLDVNAATILHEVPAHDTQVYVSCHEDDSGEEIVPHTALDNVMPLIQVEDLESGSVEDTPYMLLNSCSRSPSPIAFPSSPKSPVNPSASSPGSPVTPASICSYDGIGSSQLKRPSTLPEKLSPVEESKRKFESEIGRDILRERKLKLEMEKIQLEKQQQKVVLDKESSHSAPSSATPSEGNASEIGWSFDVYAGIDPEVELRRPKSSHSHSSDEPKRASEPIPSPSTPLDTKAFSDELSGESHRHSEPVTHNRKGMRPERKASVRELMSKFEGSTPKVQQRDSSTKSSGPSETTEQKHNESVSSLISHDVKLENQSFGVHVISPVLNKEEPLDNRDEAEPEVVSCSVTSPVSELDMTKDLESPTSETKCGPSDPARRERINRYKEERRAQLREKIKSESFRGEHDGQSEYLLRLKQKAASPTKQLDGTEDLIGFPPTSPRRRSRLSCTSIGSPVEDKSDIGLVSRRRSHVPRITELTSPNGSVESSPPGSPLKSSKDRGCGLPIPPPSPRKVLSLVENNTAKDPNQTGRSTSQTGLPSSHYGGSNRPKDLMLDRKDVNASAVTRKTPSPRKETDVFHKLRSPVKDRFATQGRSKEEEQNDCGNQSVGKNRGPPLPPRKIKDVAALFEQDFQASDKPRSRSQINTVSSSQSSLLQRQTSQDGKKSTMQTPTTPSWKSKYSSGP